LKSLQFLLGPNLDRLELNTLSQDTNDSIQIQFLIDQTLKNYSILVRNTTDIIFVLLCDLVIEEVWDSDDNDQEEQNQEKDLEVLLKHGFWQGDTNRVA